MIKMDVSMMFRQLKKLFSDAFFFPARRLLDESKIKVRKYSSLE
jgi:hypothetical protein